MSRGLGALQRRILEAHWQHWEDRAEARARWGIDHDYKTEWTIGDSKPVGELVFGDDPTASQMRSLRRAVQGLVERGHLTRVRPMDELDERDAKKRAHLADVLRRLDESWPGWYDAYAIGRQCREEDREMWATREMLFGGKSTETTQASGILRSMTAAGEVQRMRVEDRVFYRPADTV